MPKRKNVSIRTKYTTKAECIEKCRDLKKKTRLSTTFSRQIVGEVFPDGKFILSSRAKGSAMYEFRGRICEKSDGIYMVGDIVPKPYAIKSIYLYIVLGTMMALLFILSMNPVAILFSLLFAIVPWLNLLLLRNSDYLYKDIIHKVT